jgi:hypothetical protein
MMKLLYSLLFLFFLASAPTIHAQLPDLPPEACLTEAVSGCQNPERMLVKWSEGRNLWTDQACNPFDSFGNCNTNACDQANAWAQFVCASNGYDVGIWTGRKQAGCGPGGPGGPVVDGTGAISMFCQGNIPCNPFVERACDPIDQTQVEIFCCDIGAPPQPGQATIPTMSEWGMMATAAVLGIIGFIAIRRRKVSA